MKRLLAIFFLLAGGLAVEIAHPIQCSLISASRPFEKRRKLQM
ncbi:hypothetical protein [Paraburkholderia franconis]|nr:hypothetical protein [Paraburkholderia franconis]